MGSENTVYYPTYSKQFIASTAGEYLLTVEKTLKDRKDLLPFVLQYVIATGNLQILSTVDIKEFAEGLLAEREAEAEKVIMSTVEDFESFDKELLIIDICNQFQLEKKHVQKILSRLKSDGKIIVTKETVELCAA